MIWVVLLLACGLLASNVVVIWTNHRDRNAAAEERRQLVNHLLAKTPSEFTMLQLATAPRAAAPVSEDGPRAALPLGL